MILHDEIIFKLESDGCVLTLKSQQFVPITLPMSYAIEVVSLLCSANFAYEKPLKFEQALISEIKPEPVVLEAKAYECYPWVAPNALVADYGVERFQIYSDGRYTQGLMGYEHLEHRGNAKTIQIRNPSAKELQH